MKFMFLNVLLKVGLEMGRENLELSGKLESEFGN